MLQVMPTRIKGRFVFEVDVDFEETRTLDVWANRLAAAKAREELAAGGYVRCVSAAVEWGGKTP